MKYKVVVIVFLLISIGSFFLFTSSRQKNNVSRPASKQIIIIPTPSFDRGRDVKSSNDESKPQIITMYSVLGTSSAQFAAGNGISISGDSARVINNTGVLSLQGQVGALSFSSGNGISVNGLSFVNTDAGSAQAIFKNIVVNGLQFSAQNNNDSLSLVSGSGITLDTDTLNKKITIAAVTTVGDASTLLGQTWAIPGPIGTGIPNSAVFTSLTTSGTNKFSSLGAGIAHFDATGVLSSSPVNIATSDVVGLLPFSSGGTGATNAATARTNFGLVSGGAGDIWVKKAGDTMTGQLVLPTGTTTLAPLKFVAGTNLASPVAGSMEFDGSLLYFTDTGAVRRTLVNTSSTQTLAGKTLNSPVINTSITTNSNNNLVLLPNGSGITVVGDASSSSHLFNTNDDFYVSGRLEVDGLTYFDNSVNIGGGYLCLKSSNTACAGSTPGTLYASNTTVQSADVAENYISSSVLEAGDVVMPSGTSQDAVIKTTKAYQSQIIGVVSTRPGVTLNSDAQTDATHPYLYPIALSGRVPVKVSTENGAIAVGDVLTASSQPGVAMKAKKHGAYLGKALQAYNGEGVGKVMAFVTLTSSLSEEDSLPSFDVAALQSDVSSLSAKFAALSDLKGLEERITSLEKILGVASSSAEKITSKKYQVDATDSSTKSFGHASLPAGSSRVTIETNSVSDDSGIFTTAESPIASPLFISEKVPGKSFTVEMMHAPDHDVVFSWWVVN